MSAWGEWFWGSEKFDSGIAIYHSFTRSEEGAVSRHRRNIRTTTTYTHTTRTATLPLPLPVPLPASYTTTTTLAVRSIGRSVDRSCQNE